MPIIGSISGAFGYGRSPQTALPPGFTIYPPIGSTKTWLFSSNGAFSFGANSTSLTGNCFVITPLSTFVANVKVWGAGGAAGNSAVYNTSINYGGAGGATYGQMIFQSGQPYTVFSGQTGIPFTSRVVYAKPAGGGAASGILLGNAFVSSDTLIPVAIAGGGGGATNILNTTNRSGAGGGIASQRGDRYQAPFTSVSTIGMPYYSTVNPGQSPTGNSGLPLTTAYSGGTFTVYTGSGVGGGGGGYSGGNFESGGTGYAQAGDLSLITAPGTYAVSAFYDDSSRGLAGDSDQGGKISIFMDEYLAANIVATGGVVTEVPIPGYELAYRYHTFTSNGKFTVTSSGTKLSDTVDIFAVGGGGGGDGRGGGGGGGGVALRNTFSLTPGNYLVEVGSGGIASDSYSADFIGECNGGYKGGSSAFYTNLLAAKGIPDNYWRLINSFGASAILYISPSGDNTDGLSLATAFTTIEGALAKQATNYDLVVFVVLAGTYDPVIGPNATQTPITDGNYPRVFVCAPGKVTINFSPADATSRRDGPMAVLQNPQSAIYGAIIVRNMFDTTEYDLTELAFFNNSARPPTSGLRIKGSFYNCVFKENLGKWALAYDTRDDANFVVENCTFFTKDASQDINSVSGNDARRMLFKNCVFNKAVTTNATLVGCLTGVTVASKYVVTGVNDKGVYAGPYGWGATITVPEKTAKAFTMVAQGGGGGSVSASSGYILPNMIGGSGGGRSPGSDTRAPGNQYNTVAKLNYSSYGWFGGKAAGSFSSGGGGALSPGVDAVTENTAGGFGLEWPRGSGIYYGAGGAAMGAYNDLYLPSSAVGKGGAGGASAGNNGIVAVRYIVPGPYTEPAPLSLSPNILATGGQIITNTSTYIQRTFTISSTFEILYAPPGAYIDVILVGGGAGGYSLGGGAGGDLVGQRIPIDAATRVQVVIGGGGGGRYGYSWNSTLAGGQTTLTLGGYVLAAAGGSGRSSTASTWGSPGDPGKTYTDGLFANNTVYYGGSGGQGAYGGNNNPGGAATAGGGTGGTGTRSSTSAAQGGNGIANTGGGGGGGGQVDNNVDGDGGNGGSGVVIIRYSFTPS